MVEVGVVYSRYMGYSHDISDCCNCYCGTEAETVKEALLKIANHLGWDFIFDDESNVTEEVVIDKLDQLGFDIDCDDCIIRATNLTTGEVLIEHPDVEYADYEII